MVLAMIWSYTVRGAGRKGILEKGLAERRGAIDGKTVIVEVHSKGVPIWPVLDERHCIWNGPCCGI